MNRSDFARVHRYAKPKTPKLRGPQGIPPTERIYKCECCNDTGIVQVWKLNRFCFPNSHPPLTSSSNPVFCGHLPSCGNVTMQVFTDDAKDKESRTAELNLFNTPSKESTAIGKALGSGELMSLSTEQSRFVHDSVLEYRASLATPEGQAYVEAIKSACRRGITSGDTGRLTPACTSVELPPEPVTPTQPQPETIPF